jgi:hypothetical protein
MKYVISDGNSRETVGSWAKMIDVVSGWYDDIEDQHAEEPDFVFPSFFDFLDADNMDGGSQAEINTAIGSWQEAIAVACGHKPFHGHGHYSVNAQSEMGLDLTVQEGTDGALR